MRQHHRYIAAEKFIVKKPGLGAFTAALASFEGDEYTFTLRHNAI